MGKLALLFGLVFASCLVCAQALGQVSSNLCQAPPPQAVVDCPDCKQDTVTTYNGKSYFFHVDSGNSTILSGKNSQGSSLRYKWDNSDFGSNADIELQNIRFASTHILTVTDLCGRSDTVTATISVVDTTPCLPSWDQDEKITIDDDLNRKELSPGDSVGVNIPRPDNGCDNYKAVCESKAVRLINYENGSLILYVDAVPGPDEPNPVIKIVSGSGASLSPNPPEYDDLRIVPNTPPTIKTHYNQGNGEIIVSCADSTTGINGSMEGYDFIKYFYANITDSNGSQVDSGDSSADFGQQVNSITLQPDEAGTYILNAKISDSHGAEAIAEPQVVGIYGARGEVPDQLVLSNTTYTCHIGQPCHIDTSKISTMYKYTDLSFEFWDVTYFGYPRLVSYNPTFDHIYTQNETGSHDIEVRVKKFCKDNDYYCDERPSNTTVTVNVIQDTSLSEAAPQKIQNVTSAPVVQTQNEKAGWWADFSKWLRKILGHFLLNSSFNRFSFPGG